MKLIKLAKIIKKQLKYLQKNDRRETFRKIAQQQKANNFALYVINESLKGSQVLQSFLLASKYYLGEVYTRTSMLTTIQDVFASDIHCHKRCINNYLLKYKCRKSADRNPQNVEKNFKIQKSYDAIMFEINLNENDYSLSEI